MYSLNYITKCISIGLIGLLLELHMAVGKKKGTYNYDSSISTSSDTTIQPNPRRRNSYRHAKTQLISFTSINGDDRFIEKLQKFRHEMFPDGPATDRKLREIQSTKESPYMTSKLVAQWLPLECKVLPLNLRKRSVIHEGKRNQVTLMEDADGRQYAYKTFENPDEYTMELQFFMFAQHDYIVKPVCIMRGSGGKGGILLDYVNGSSSIDYASQRSTTDDDLQRISAQLLSAIEYIHWLGFVHADMKPENVMIDRDGNIKVIDFGFAIPLPYGKANRGTPTTIAPELVGAVEGEIHEGIDWWAYGSTVAIWFGLHQKLGKSRKYVPLRVLRDDGMKFGKVPTEFSKDVRELVYLFLTPNPERRKINTRLQLKFIRDLPFFENVDWSTVYHH